MLNKLRSFSNTKLAGVIVAIIIIPFVFWGMGSLFSGGNTNNVAKINNETVSTQDFVDYINRSRLNNEHIKQNIDNNILERILSELISKKLLEMEVKQIKILISDKTLINKIKKNKDFFDEKNKFSRIKYEKFLLENNLTAPNFENILRKQELKKHLFNYISGGIKSPYFLQNKIYMNETKQVEINYINLDKVYDNEISSTEFNKFIKDNEESVKEDYIDFSYTKITPKKLIEIEEFNDEFFKKIDAIENDILNGSNINEIANNYNLDLISKNKFQVDDSSKEILKEIYLKRKDNNIQLLDKNDYFLLFEISKIEKILPNKTNPKFIKKVKDNIILQRKYDLHQDLFKKIQDKKLDNIEFKKIAKIEDNIENTKINGITDNNIFDSESIKLIYSLPNNSFTLITDEKNKIYIANIKNINSYNLDKDDKKINDYHIKSNNNIIYDIYSSYDLSLNDKYKVKVFQTTLDRVKNYFK